MRIIAIDLDGTLYSSSQLTTAEIVSVIKEEISKLVTDKEAREISEKCIKDGAVGIFNYLLAINKFNIRLFEKSCRQIVKKIDYSRIKKNTELLEIINELKIHYEVYVFTNNVKEHIEKVFEKLFDSNIKRANIKCFDITSTYCAKTQSFAPKQSNGLSVFCKQISCKPQECILLDDTPRNIIAAQKIGMKAIYVKENDCIIEKLKALL